MIDAFYPVVPDSTWVARLVPVGAKFVQLRIKDKPDAERRRQVREARELHEQSVRDALTGSYNRRHLDAFEAAQRDRIGVVKVLKAMGIGTQVHYIPVHRQPYYAARYGVADLPGADAWYARCLSLPLYPTMADSDVDRVVEGLAAALGIRL